MKKYGPLATLVAVVLLGAVLLVVNMISNPANADHRRPGRRGGGGRAGRERAAAATPPSPRPPSPRRRRPPSPRRPTPAGRRATR